MPHTTRLMTFAVKRGKEARAGEWMRTQVQRRAKCVESPDREVAPQTFEHIVDFVLTSIEAAIVEREARLAAT
jgi:hypothetical protein